MIYADNAATTALDSDAFEAMKPYLLEKYGNASQPYSFASSSKQALKNARGIVADCIGAQPEEIFFTSGGTESDNWAIKGLVSDSCEKQTILTNQIEHHAILNACAAMEYSGTKVTYMPVNRAGLIKEDRFERAIGRDTQLVSIMLANNEIGTIEPIRELTEIAHKYGVLFHTDAVQAVGHIPVNVCMLGVDMLSASAHKFNGPKGIGFLYVKNGSMLRPFVNGGSQEFNMRAGTENVASVVAMAVALRKNCLRIEETKAKLQSMEERFIEILDKEKIDYVRNGSENHIPGNINISIKNANGEMLLHRLDLKGICISTGSACDSVSTQISHVIQAIRVPKEYAEGTIRISFGRNNVESDAKKVAESIVSIIKECC